MDTIYQHYIGSTRTRLGSLKRDLEFELCRWKYVVGREDFTKGAQPSFLQKLFISKAGRYFALTIPL